MNLKKYIAELKRRNVFKAGIAYLIVAWVITEVASVVLPTFNAPAYFMKALLIILIIGFPINLIFSWIYDITREGLKKTEDIDQEAQKSRLTGNRLNKVIIISLSLVVVLLVFNQFRNTPDQIEGKVENSEIVDSIDIDEQSIAVLPLTNLNGDKQLDYFSDGVTQEIIDELAKVDQLNLSSFSSTRLYKNTDKSPKEISTELGVSMLLSGTARIDGDSFSLSFELVNGGTGIRIWGMQYDDVRSNSIRIQNDIAQQLVAGLDIELSQEEKTNLNKINTNSHEAFTLYLKAKAEFYDLTKDGLASSIIMLGDAIELDPKYAQAYTLLAWIHILNGHAGIMGHADVAVNTVEKARPLIEHSISIDSSISDNYLIMGALNLFYLNNLPSAIENVEKSLSLSAWPKLPTNYCICTAISVYAALGKLGKATELVNIPFLTLG